MSQLSSAIQRLLQQGRAEGMFSGAAAAVRTPTELITAYVGTHAWDDPQPVTAASQFDLASVSKTFTAAVLVNLVESGVIDIDEPIRPVMEIGTGVGAETITLRMLLTHTAGLPGDVFIWRDPSIPVASRLERALASRLVALPDTVFQYSCLGYIAAGVLAERLTGRSLAELIDELVASPLALRSVRFGPIDRNSAVATEDESYLGRGVVRGEVHDELSWYLGGRTGNAGLFANTMDVLTLASAFLDLTIAGDAGTRLMMTNQIEPRHGADYRHGLGVRISDQSFMGDVDGFGHTGFTGTMWIADPARCTAAALLTNRVHPTRDKVDLSAFRRLFNQTVASTCEAARSKRRTSESDRSEARATPRSRGR